MIKSIEAVTATILKPTYIVDPNKKKRVLNISSGTLKGFMIILGAPSHGASGGGVAIAQTATVKNCCIRGNISQGEGGGVFLTDDGNLYNNIIHNNVANAGSGIFATSAHGEIVNNTIVGNNIVIDGDCTGLLLRNNIIYNSQPDISFTDYDSQSGVTIDYSLLDYDIGFGSTNIFEDPQFIDNVDFLLDPTSPCIDAGHPDNQYRDRDDSRNDIGAYGGPSASL